MQKRKNRKMKDISEKLREREGALKDIMPISKDGIFEIQRRKKNKPIFR